MLSVDLRGATRDFTIGGRKFWLFVGLLVLGAGLPIWGGFSGLDIERVEQKVRIGSMFLQLAGLLLVAHGLSKTRRQFDVTSLHKHFSEWWQQFRGRFVRQDVRGTSAIVMEGIDSGESFGHQTITVARDASIIDRIVALEENLKTTTDRVARQELRLIEEARKADEAVRNEQRIREEETTHLRTQLKEFSTGGLDLELIGLLWLVVATVMGSLSKEIACLLVTWIT